VLVTSFSILYQQQQQQQQAQHDDQRYLNVPAAVVVSVVVTVHTTVPPTTFSNKLIFLRRYARARLLSLFMIMTSPDDWFSCTISLRLW